MIRAYSYIIKDDPRRQKYAGYNIRNIDSARLKRPSRRKSGHRPSSLSPKAGIKYSGGIAPTPSP